MDFYGTTADGEQREGIEAVKDIAGSDIWLKVLEISRGAKDVDLIDIFFADGSHFAASKQRDIVKGAA
jgi:hypothetical protein